jgi:hypothetical protein
MYRPVILGVPWNKLPIEFRRKWWRATDFNQHPPSPEFEAQMPELLAVEQALEINRRRKIAADTARAREFLARDHQRCGECLRPASPCERRCLRSMLDSTAAIRTSSDFFIHYVIP